MSHGYFIFLKGLHVHISPLEGLFHFSISNFVRGLMHTIVKTSATYCDADTYYSILSSETSHL